MRKLFFLTAVLVSSMAYSAVAQCNPDEFTTECIPKLSKGYNFLKGYKIDGKNGQKAKIEYSYVFTKGTQYMINVCSENNSGIIISLFDSKRNKVASSKKDGQYATAIAFPCKSTSIYYINYTFDNGNEYCGGSALGFRK